MLKSQQVFTIRKTKELLMIEVYDYLLVFCLLGDNNDTSN